MSTRARTVPIIALPLLLAVTGATAQQLDLQAPGPERPRDRRPALPNAERDPDRPPVPYRPGFIEPLTKETDGGRMGAAGWTSPNVPTGSRVTSDPDKNGWLGFGFAIETGAPKSVTR
jgi:hypothetical protein